jgi:hypothetical protein
MADHAEGPVISIPSASARTESSRSLSRSHHSGSSDDSDHAGRPEISTRAKLKSESTRSPKAREDPPTRGRARTKSKEKLDQLDAMIRARSQSRSRHEMVQNVIAAQRPRSQESEVLDAGARLELLNRNIRERSRSRHRASLSERVADIRSRSVSCDRVSAVPVETAPTQASALHISKQASLESSLLSPSVEDLEPMSLVPAPVAKPQEDIASASVTPVKPKKSFVDKTKTKKKTKEKSSTSKASKSPKISATKANPDSMPPIPGLPKWYVVDPNNPPVRMNTSSKQKFTPDKRVETIDEYLIFLQDGTMDVKTISKITDKPTWHVV